MSDTEGVSVSITKLEAARRQLDTAIDLYFDNADSLSIHTLAFASLKVLFDIYPHHKDDGFTDQMNAILKAEGWRLISSVANFLKHADRDPYAVLASHSLDQTMSIIGFATLLYRRLSGDYSLKMKAFDHWWEELAYEKIGIEEIDKRKERVATFDKIRNDLREMSHDQRMVLAKQIYQHFLEHFERLQKVVDEAKAAGMEVTELLDREIPKSAS
ncbi:MULTISPECIES: hypothetical protein [unclassified Beijerinckia]|uniref:hypothetical protein n=1 Tax=unclassified Beijerinckia TaxID=2638183 RepID=UPI00089C083A|nr:MULTISPECIES: hypothetical protein [unclassified Beijerinckia]MDH7795806.1 hypothetical protein [Beijerinckia sp. GAS462]SEC17172.1 hypothetical protein SAMN05443249_2084 [Beijerinckia sp. 28-YEA-48]